MSRQILQYSRRLDELESEYDALTEKERKLQSLNEELITLREKCDIIQKTKAFFDTGKGKLRCTLSETGYGCIPEVLPDVIR